MTTPKNWLSWTAVGSLAAVTILCTVVAGWALAEANSADITAGDVKHEFSTHVAAQAEHEKHVMYRLEEIKSALDRIEKNGK